MPRSSVGSSIGAPNFLRHGHSEPSKEPPAVESRPPTKVPEGTPQFDVKEAGDAEIDGFDAGGERALAHPPLGSLRASTLPANSALLSWVAPVTDVPLVGYKVVFGNSPTQLTKTATLRDPTATTVQLNNLPSGTWYFAVKSVAANAESVPSNVVWKAIP